MLTRFLRCRSGRATFSRPTPANRKSCSSSVPADPARAHIGRVLRATIGRENVCGPTLAGLSTNFGLWPLVGKSLAIVSDARLGGRDGFANCGGAAVDYQRGGRLTIDRKNLEPMTVKLPTRLMIFTNELPRLGDSSGALAGRMILLRLEAEFLRARGYRA